MEYRRFGKTEKELSVITLGGMRFKHVWEAPRHIAPDDSLQQCQELLKIAFDNGINHIETAYGYQKSETIFGLTFKELKIDRSSYYLMTKGDATTASGMRRMVEEQLKTLNTDYFDFYAWHGMNTDSLYQIACSKGGAVEELIKMKQEGLIKHVGFSTHAPLETIIKAIETDLFEFVNLHYYYFFQRNAAAIALANSRDMGVFIISPNDKGGQLFNAPQKVKNAIGHATPIQWNARFCLQDPNIHTLSFGMTEANHFSEMNGIFPVSSPMNQNDLKAQLALDQMLRDDPYSGYEGYEMGNDPSGINIPEILRLRKLWKCYDMQDFGKYRYKEFRTPNHWVPGVFATPENIEKVDLSQVPSTIPLKELLGEAHEAFFVAPQPKTMSFNNLKAMFPKK